MEYRKCLQITRCEWATLRWSEKEEYDEADEEEEEEEEEECHGKGPWSISVGTRRFMRGFNFNTASISKDEIPNISFA